MITSIISALFFYLFPTLLGRGIFFTCLRLASKITQKTNQDTISEAKHNNISIPYPFVSYFIIGVLCFYLIFTGVYYGTNILGLTIPTETLLQMIIAALTLTFIPLNALLKPYDLRIKANVLPIALSAIVSCAVYLIWLWKSPYPLNWDIYEHQTLVNNILMGRFSVIPSFVTDTFGFNGYSTVFHTTIAASQSLFTTSVLQFWNSISYIHFFLVTLASYYIAKEATGNKTVGYISLLVSGFIFDSSISFTSLFLIPQNFTAVVFIFLMCQLLSFARQNTTMSKVLFLTGSIFLLLNHYIVGFIALSLYLGTYIYFNHPKLIRYNLHKTTAAYGLLFIALVVILFSSSIPLSSINNGEAEAFTLTLTDKFNLMKQSYGYLLPLFVPLGIWTILKRKHEFEVLVLFIFTLLAALIFTQFPYVMKFFVLERFFTGIIIALGIYSILKLMHAYLQIAAYALLVIGLCIIFTGNTMLWKGLLLYNTSYTNISEEEIEAAEFLNNNYYKTNTILISDPATQYVLEPLSRVNTQGGAYMNTETRQQLDKIGKSETLPELAKNINAVEDKIEPASDTKLIALSARYFLWQKAKMQDKLNLNYNIWQPTDLSLEDRENIQEILSDTKHFELVFMNEGMAIVKVKP